MSGELGAGVEKPETNESVEGDTSWKSRSKNALRREGQERWESSISQQIPANVQVAPVAFSPVKSQEFNLKIKRGRESRNRYQGSMLPQSPSPSSTKQKSKMEQLSSFIDRFD